MTGQAVLNVRYFAGARAAAGRDSETITLAPASTVDDVVAALSARHGPELAKVLAACSYLLDEIAVRDTTTAVPDEAVLDVLPPFAGG